MQQQVDTLIKARYVIPVEPEGVVLENHCLIVDQGHIVAISTLEECQEYSPTTVVEYPHHAIAPGLVNAHSHVAMTLFRGLADDLPLMTWLQEHIWPAEAKFVDAEFCRLGSELAIAEMLLGGTTCFNDMYFFPNVTGQVAQQAGIRAVVGLIVIDAPTVWAADTDEYLRRATEVHDEFRSAPRVTTAFAPHAPYTVSDQALNRINVLAEELDIPIHIHVHETKHEVDEAFASQGKRPLERLRDLGLLSPRMLAVHMTELDPEEMATLAQHGVHVVHCPESNMKLASGRCEVSALHGYGVNVALGTDGAASNNDLDMFGEMRSAALLAKDVAGDATGLPAARALTMATLSGAEALGQAEQFGSLVVGKSADLIAVNLATAATMPVYNPISQLVYAASRDNVEDVWTLWCGSERI